MTKIDGATYKKWHEIYVRCTTEKAMVDAALNSVIAALPSKDTFLDVGAGEGNLTFRVAKKFKNVVVVEPNAQVRNLFESKGAEFICDYFDRANLGDRHFDFVLCSHVFWLVQRTDQPAFIKKMYDHLAPGGKLAIVMVSPLGQSHEFYKKFFFGYDTTTHDILRDLHVMGLRTEVVPVSFEFGSDSFDDFFSICKLFTLESWLHPAKATDERIRTEIGDVTGYTETKLTEIEQWIRENCYRNGSYRMNEEVDILVVTK